MSNDIQIGEDAYTLSQARPYILSNIVYQIKQSSMGEQPSPMVLTGPPGIGKSFELEAICKQRGWGLLCIYLSNTLLHQLTGLPQVKVGKGDDSKFVPWSMPDIFDLNNLTIQAKDKEGNPIETMDELVEKRIPVVLFLDDIHLTGPDIQKFLFQLLTQKAINKNKLPSNVVIMMAGNRAEDRAGARSMNSGISSRVQFLPVKMLTTEWVKNYALPNELRTDIISYHQYYDGKLNGTPLENGPWPCSRSWSEASRLIDTLESMYKRHLTTTEMMPILEGKVGKETAQDFYAYREVLMKWEPARIMSKQKRVVEESKDRKSKDDIVIEELKQIEAYALMAAVIGELQKILREEKFKPSKQTNEMMDFVAKTIISPMTRRFRAVVPLGLKTLILEESNFGNVVLVKKLLTDPDIVKELLEIVK